MASAVRWGRMFSPERTPSVTGGNLWGRPKCSEPDTPRLPLSEDSLDSRTHETPRTAQVGSASRRTATVVKVQKKQKKHNFSNQLQCLFSFLDSVESAQREISFFFPDFSAEEWMEKEEPSLRSGHFHYDHEKQMHIVSPQSWPLPCLPSHGMPQFHLASHVPSVSFFFVKAHVFRVIWLKLIFLELWANTSSIYCCF